MAPLVWRALVEMLHRRKPKAGPTMMVACQRMCVRVLTVMLGQCTNGLHAGPLCRGRRGIKDMSHGGPCSETDTRRGAQSCRV